MGYFESAEAGSLCFVFTDARTGVVAKAKSYVTSPATVRLSYVTRSRVTWIADRDHQFYGEVGVESACVLVIVGAGGTCD